MAAGRSWCSRFRSPDPSKDAGCERPLSDDEEEGDAHEGEDESEAVAEVDVERSREI